MNINEPSIVEIAVAIFGILALAYWTTK